MGQQYLEAHLTFRKVNRYISCYQRKIPSEQQVNYLINLINSTPFTYRRKSNDNKKELANIKVFIDAIRNKHILTRLLLNVHTWKIIGLIGSVMAAHFGFLLPIINMMIVVTLSSSLLKTHVHSAHREINALRPTEKTFINKFKCCVWRSLFRSFSDSVIVYKEPLNITDSFITRLSKLTTSNSIIKSHHLNKYLLTYLVGIILTTVLNFLLIMSPIKSLLSVVLLCGVLPFSLGAKKKSVRFSNPIYIPKNYSRRAKPKVRSTNQPSNYINFTNASPDITDLNHQPMKKANTEFALNNRTQIPHTRKFIQPCSAAIPLILRA